jgi:hypothetical protein
MDALLEPVAQVYIWALGLLLFLVLTVACEIGFRLGRWRLRRNPKAADEASATATLTGGMLALLAFMLGLTVDFAQNRFDARRELVAVEANAIGTAWLRAKLVGGEDGEALAAQIADYAKTRLAFAKAGYTDRVGELNARTGEQQDRIWALVTSIANKSPNAVSAVLVNAVNEMIDSSLSQRFAFETHVPPNMMLLLTVGSVMAISAAGYQLGLAGYRQLALTSLLLLMWTGGVMMTIDLNRPRLGSIRVETAPLEWTIRSFTTSPPAPHAP